MSRQASVLSRAAFGLETHLVHVECHLAGGLPGTTIVGLAEGAVRESRDRVKSAIRSSGFNYPTSHITLNLAPSHLSKTGSGFDLPIAIAILAASGQLPSKVLKNTEFVGELGLFGEMRMATNVLSSAIASQGAGHRLFLPNANRREIQLIPEGNFHTALNLTDVVQQLCGKGPSPAQMSAVATELPGDTTVSSFDQVLGQHLAKRALTVAAAGGHHMLMVGPPGTGKTLLAQSLIDLLPELRPDQALEVAAIYSAHGSLRQNYRKPPLRRPHHSVSSVAMGGGGIAPMPGEVTLAHQGVLFLDELPHFKPTALDLLREPIETGEIAIARARYRTTFPSRFQLIAAMNPCPAGRSCKEQTCRCSPAQVQRYQSRISGPLLDRIDLHVLVPEVDHKYILNAEQTRSARARQQGPTLAHTKRLVARAQSIQFQRQQCLNGHLLGSSLSDRIDTKDLDADFVANMMQRFDLSMRSYHKLLRIALTLADLDQAELQIKQTNLAAEALEDSSGDGTTHMQSAENEVLVEGSRAGRKVDTVQPAPDPPESKLPIRQKHLIEALNFRAMEWLQRAD